MMTALLIVNPSDVVNCAQAGLKFDKWKEEWEESHGQALIYINKWE